MRTDRLRNFDEYYAFLKDLPFFVHGNGDGMNFAQAAEVTTNKYGDPTRRDRRAIILNVHDYGAPVGVNAIPRHEFIIDAQGMLIANSGRETLPPNDALRRAGETLEAMKALFEMTNKRR